MKIFKRKTSITWIIGYWKPACRRGRLDIGNSRQRRGGFTVIEVLVASVLTAVIMSVAGSSFFYLLRGASKAELVKEVKQNGDYALSVLGIKIRNARDVTSACSTGGTNANTIQITNPDRSTSLFDCQTTGSISRFRERITPTSGPASTNYLTNPSVTLQGGCSTTFFTCRTLADGKSKVVSISYTLTGSVSAPASEAYTQNFSTQISLRNN